MNDIIADTVLFVKKQLTGAEGGHDWFHIERVYRNALLIAADVNCDLLVVKLAALLHDIADSKFHNGDETVGPKRATEFLQLKQVDSNTIEHVVKIIENISFKGGNVIQNFDSVELQIVQDADRLDAIGAVGIARAFNYGGFKGRALYDPEIKPRFEMNREEYKKSDGPTVNHFYEKLLKLSSKMNTDSAKQIAAQRHEFLELFLTQFYDEWEGRK